MRLKKLGAKRMDLNLVRYTTRESWSLLMKERVSYRRQTSSKSRQIWPLKRKQALQNLRSLTEISKTRHPKTTIHLVSLKTINQIIKVTCYLQSLRRKTRSSKSLSPPVSVSVSLEILVTPVSVSVSLEILVPPVWIKSRRLPRQQARPPRCREWRCRLSIITL